MVAGAKRALPVYCIPSELHRMLAACGNERDRMLIAFLWRTGARASEAIGVRVGDLTAHGVRLANLKQGMWRKRGDGASEHVRVSAEKHVILGVDFLAELKAYCAGMPPETPIFGRFLDGKPISRKRAWQIVKKASAEAGVLKRRYGDEQLRPAWTHTLRHSAAVNLLENNVGITVVADQLGHSNLSSTQVYTKISDPRKIEIINGVKF